MKLSALVLASILSAEIANAWSETDTVQDEFKDIVSNCLNWALRWFPDHTIGCLTPRTFLLSSSEKSYLDSKSLRWIMQEVNWEVRLVIAKKPPVKSVQSAILNERAIPHWWNPSHLPLKSPPSVGNYQIPNRSNNPTPFVIGGAGEVSINWKKVYISP